MNSAPPSRAMSRRLLPVVVATALFAGALGAGASPALAEEAPASLEVSGIVVVLPDETGAHSIATDVGMASGIWLASGEGPLLPLAEQTIDSADAEELRSGARFEGTVELPAPVADAVAVAEGASDLEVLEIVAEATGEAGLSLPVQEARIVPPLAAAAAVAPHQADVLFLSRSSGQTLTVPSVGQMQSVLGVASGFWAGETDGRVPSITADRVEQEVASPAFSVCDPEAAWVDAANHFGTDLEDYLVPGSTKHLVVLVNDTSAGCGVGLGSAGVKLNGGLVWVNLGGRAIAESAQPLAHEIGHNFGLAHANARVCSGSAVDAPYGPGGLVAAPCTDVEYGDLWSTMGIGVIGHMSVPAPISLNQREYLDAVPDGAVRSVTAADGASQSFTLKALGSGSGLRGLRVEPAGADPFLVEYRNGVSPDPALPSNATLSLSGASLRANPGVKVLKSPSPDAYGAASTVLTRRPAGGGIAHETLSAGDSLAPLGGAKVTVTGLSQAQATVLVEFLPSSALTAGTPTISGKAKVGATLTADSGAWAPEGVQLGYQWKRAGKAIAGATKASYKLVAADAGKKITVTVTGKKSGYPSASKTSAATAAIGKALTVKTPTISGTVKVGAKLTAKPGAWKPGGVKFSYVWLRNGEAIAGATKASYKLVAADAAAQVSVRVTGKKSGYHTEAKASVMKRVPLVMATAKPAVSGAVKVGKTLTATPGAWTEGVKFSYQWKRAGKAIKGAKKASYKLVSADAGKKVTVTVTGKKSGYSSESKTSAAKAVPRVLAAKTPTISGTVKVGSALKIKMSAWKPKGVKFSHQWLRDGEPIAGSAAKKSSYKPTAADAGTRISVRVTGKKSGYHAEVKTSAAKKIPLVITPAKPTISGTVKVGQALTVVTGAWAPEGVQLSYQWKRAGKAVKGATKASYKLTAADKGKKITVTVTGKKQGYASEVRTSKATAAISYPSRTSPASSSNCPSWAPIKGNASSMIYHVPGGQYYKVTKPEECFTTAAAAKAAGYRASKR